CRSWWWRHGSSGARSGRCRTSRSLRSRWPGSGWRWGSWRRACRCWSRRSISGRGARMRSRGRCSATLGRARVAAGMLWGVGRCLLGNGGADTHGDHLGVDEAGELLGAHRVLQLADRLGLDLADALAGDLEDAPDLLEGVGVPVADAVAEL